MTWDFVATTREGIPYGELRNANPRTLRFGLGGADTFQWTIDADHPQATVLQDVGRTIIKVYNDATGVKVPRLCGPVITREKQRSTAGGRIALTAASPIEAFRRRLVGKGPEAVTRGSPGPLSPLDRGVLITELLDALNNGSATWGTDAADTGLRIGDVTASSLSYLEGIRFTPANEVLATLIGTLDGPDIRVRPIEPVLDATGLQLGYLDVAPFIGTIQPNVIWEFGTGRLNVAEWNDRGDATSLANLAYHLPPGYPDNATQGVLSAADATSQSDYGLNEVVVPGDIAADELRQRLIDEHIAIRRVPRRVITFSPVAEIEGLPAEDRRVPRLFVDYSPGDVVIFRALERFSLYDVDGAVVGTREEVTVNAYFRVHAVTLTFDDAGVATPTLTLVEDENTVGL